MRLGLWWSSQRRHRRISVRKSQQRIGGSQDTEAYFTIHTVTKRIASIRGIDIDSILEFTAVTATGMSHSESGNREQGWPVI